MSEDANKEVKLSTTVSAVDFAKRISPSTLISSIQKDLVRVHDIAMAETKPTTFVLSDFNIQLKAVVTQEADKAMLVLPTQPGAIDPNILSSVNITLKPIPLTVSPTAPTGAGIKPVEAIQGIGLVLGERLRKVGIETVADLAVAPTQKIIDAGIPKAKAEEFVSMAKLMVKGEIAGVEGVDEQTAELLVVAAKIDSKEKLAQADPETLYKVLNEAIVSKRVKLPARYTLTIEDVKTMVNSAQAVTEVTKRQV
ncbi:MAG: DUF4332 domain-containing protein [Candidatus Bathyarchaeota archaeon]|nr:DUF4332 domain-containing protein [Candidatus Bathyarchaeota archaeon]